MYVNRFTISLDPSGEASLGDRLVEFNRCAAYFEDAFHSFRKKRLDAAGYGFVHLVATEKKGVLDLRHGGQIITLTLTTSLFNGVLEKAAGDKLKAFVRFARAGLTIISKELAIDLEGFMEAIRLVDEEGDVSVLPLSISRWSKDRRFQVLFVWQRQMGTSPLRLIVLNKQEEVIKDLLLRDDITSWILGYDWKKSEWDGYNIVIRDLQGRITSKIDLKTCWSTNAH